MFDEIGKFIANSILTAGWLFLLILDIILLYLNEKKAKWIAVSIILNIIAGVYFGGYANELIVFFNLVIWPSINFLVIGGFFIKNIILYTRDKEKYKIEHKQSDTKKRLFKIAIIILTIWIFAVVGYFFYAIFGFFQLL